MRKNTQRFSINLNSWVEFSKNDEIIERIRDDRYSKVYPILILYFKGILIELCWDKLILALHVVYGWMPTIPKFKKVMNWAPDKKATLVELLKEIISKESATEEQFDLLKDFSNNSAVGASKLLHFFAPETFPMWDSRVAAAFYYPTKVSNYQVNKTESWLKYTASLSAWIKNPEVKKRCSELRRGADFLKDVSDIRMVELVLLHEKKS